ncbi:MAG: M23 family metallopeptidase [Rhodothermales bacterium]|nr:M23 family metallopeptidase [Rhodothermales bacterium]
MPMRRNKERSAEQSSPPKRRWLWIGPLLILLITIAWWILITNGGRVGAAAWFLFPVVVPLLGLITVVAALVSALRKRSSWRQAIPVILVGVLALYPLSWMGLNFPFAFPTSADRVKPATHIRVPADVPMKVLYGGNSLSTNYHASMPENRWAYDLAVEPHPDWQTSPDLSLEDYGCWGTPIVAPASGRVLVAHDGEPDHPPGTPWQIAYPPDRGNHVTIELAGGTVLNLDHLQQGSVQVEPGDAVSEGTVVGRCGNSGNSVTPHLHIDHRPELSSPERRLPFLVSLPLFFRDHGGVQMPEGGYELDSEGTRIWTGDTISHEGE